MKRIVVLVSGGGTNLQALLDAEKRGEILGGEITAVVSSTPGAFALERAAKAGVAGYVVNRKEYDSRESFTDALLTQLEELHADLIVLAGFLYILSPAFINRYENRIINIHPALIPSFCGNGFYGLKVHEKALEYGVKLTGATVHFVSAEADAGPIILQKAVAIKEDDTPEILQRRVMEEAEWKILPEAVSLFCQDRLHVEGRIVHIEDKPLCTEETKERNTMHLIDIENELQNNSYPGRGIILGRSEDGKHSVAAYWIMGRSVNSRNRIFVQEPDGIRTEAFDPSKMEDPSLIIYHPVRTVGRGLIVTNGDQTDTIREFIEKGLPMEQALRTREFEPDDPNWTPRISGLLSPDGSYKLSILKSADAEGSGCLRQTFEYPGQIGVGHFIHTYENDGNPLPSFAGEPKAVRISGDIESFSKMLWNALNADNKVSLFVRYIDLETNASESLIYNRHQR